MLFIARKYKNLRIVLDPKGAKEVEGRRMMVGLKGLFPTGKVAEFENGLYETNDEKVIKALKAHDGYGASFTSEGKGGGVEVLSPKAQADKEEKAQLAAAAADTDPKKGKKDKEEQATPEPQPTNEDDQD